MQPNDTTVSHTLRGPDPRALAFNRGLELQYGVSMAGHNGAYLGARGPMMTGGYVFSGELGPLQQFARGLQGSTTSTLRSMVEARLPSTSTPPNVLNPNLQTILTNGGA